MLKYKPSVLAACMLYLGFQLQFEINLRSYELGTAAGRRKVTEVCEVFRLWHKILSKALEVADVPKIMDFCDMLFERQITLHEEYRDQFRNIYRERVREYFVGAPAKKQRMVEQQSRTQESPPRRVEQR